MCVRGEGGMRCDDEEQAGKGQMGTGGEVSKQAGSVSGEGGWNRLGKPDRSSLHDDLL
jgi:hypothetical protein